MENRFGIKDFFLFLFVGVLLVAVLLAMKQFDRQYDEVLNIKRQNSELTRDLVDIKRQLAEGVTFSGAAPGSTAVSPDKDPFYLVREAEKKPGFARGDWLVDNFSTKIGRLTPLISTDIYQRWVEYQVMEPLSWRDPYTLEYKPLLASHWEISPDGLNMKFFLRKGVSFSDGDPFDADDVIFTFKWIQNEAVNAPRIRSYLTKLKELKKIDSHTVEFVFTEPYYLNFDTVASQQVILAQHFYSRFTPDEFNEKTGLVMGTGPYKMQNPETWTPGQLVQLFRNDRYWGVAPTFDRIIFHEIQGEAQEMVIYGNQEHDLIRCTPDQFEKLKKDKRIMDFSNEQVYDNIFSGYVYTGWNQVRKVNGQDTPTRFADKRVRQAMTILLDRERVCREIYLGYATPASGPFLPTNPQSDPSVKPWPYSESAGKALLEQAGFTDGNGDGVLEGPDGQPFKFVLTYPSGNETTEKIVLFMKDNYARAGIVLEPDRQDWPVLVQKLTLGDFDAITLGWSSEPESDPYQIFHSSQIAGQGDNRTSYKNPELDKVIDKARVTMDRDQRMKLWNEVHRIVHEDQPYTFLFNRKALRYFNKRIHNIEKSKMSLNFELMNGGVIPWFVPSGLQRHTR